MKLSLVDVPVAVDLDPAPGIQPLLGLGPRADGPEDGKRGGWRDELGGERAGEEEADRGQAREREVEPEEEERGGEREGREEIEQERAAWMRDKKVKEGQREKDHQTPETVEPPNEAKHHGLRRDRRLAVAVAVAVAVVAGPNDVVSVVVVEMVESGGFGERRRGFGRRGRGGDGGVKERALIRGGWDRDRWVLEWRLGWVRV